MWDMEGRWGRGSVVWVVVMMAGCCRVLSSNPGLTGTIPSELGQMSSLDML